MVVSKVKRAKVKDHSHCCRESLNEHLISHAVTNEHAQHLPVTSKKTLPAVRLDSSI